MWTSFCSGRLVCVVILAAAMLVSPSAVVAADAYVPVVGLSCCSKVGFKIREKVKACYEQKPRVGCKLHAFRVITESNREWCISPDSRWLKIKIRKGDLLCRPEIS